MTREIRVTSGSSHGLFLADPRVELADLDCGFAFFNLTAASRRGLVVLAPHPRIRPAAPKMIQNLPRSYTKASLGPILRSYVSIGV